MNNKNTCIPINTEQEFYNLIKDKKSMYVLFYASWCGFCQRFLPIFEKCSLDTSNQCYKMMIDDHPELSDRFQIDVYPTVIFFKNGNLYKRLDGVQGMGLNEMQFRNLVNVCDNIK